MSDSCDHNCDSCSQDDKFTARLNDMSQVKKVIGVVSGKGGVGKSLVTSLLAVAANQKGLRTAIIDADITGPSIPKAFGIKTKAINDKSGLFPILSKTGIEIMSINLLLKNETDPIIWRGPVIAGMVKQFWSDVTWGDIDIMFVDMPPGTGDVPLTVFQSIPVDGIIIVTSPQDLVSVIVSKAVSMAKKMNIPMVGLVENMAYFMCPHCHEKTEIFGKSHLEEISKKYKIINTISMPINPTWSKACDEGLIETVSDNPILPLMKAIYSL